jgi:enoyl-[acyl-carrier protein] reductase/trans-2-enoyl-CoA reductase (NAD+)
LGWFRESQVFGSNAGTISVLKTSNRRKTASPGWYNSAAFEQEAHAAGLYAKSVNGDAFLMK